MAKDLLLGLTGIIVLGIGAQWVSWRLRLPAILALLVAGFLAGPVAGVIDPDALMGEVLFPFVSLAVAIILFEGGLSLNTAELREIGRVVRNLIVWQVALTWVAATALAVMLLDLSFALASLFGAILTVTGPTVIVPLLRHIRPEGRIGSLVKWEGIVNDPIGAILAVLVFEAIRAGGFQEGIAVTALGVLKAGLLGGAMGLAGAGFIVIVLKRHWIPDYLQNPMALALVLAVFSASNLVQAESGLLAVTLMGVALASQRVVTLRHIVEFKENLRVLLISVLFIVLAARLPLTDADYTSTGSLLFLAALILFVRPAVVALATLRSSFTWRERAFLAVMAPRGIVAASVASLFALQLEDGLPEATRLIPLTFLVIGGTVTVYGLSAPWVARWLRLATPNPQGIVMVGVASWARAAAKALIGQGVKVVLVDSNWGNVTAARNAGLKTYYANFLTERTMDEMELAGIGRLLAVTPNDEVNTLAALHVGGLFPRSHVYQLAPEGEARGGRHRTIPPHLSGRILFGKEVTHALLTERHRTGWVIKTDRLTNEFDFSAFRSRYGETAIPLFAIRESGEVLVFTADTPPTPKPGHVLVSLVDPKA